MTILKTITMKTMIIASVFMLQATTSFALLWPASPKNAEPYQFMKLINYRNHSVKIWHIAPSGKLELLVGGEIGAGLHEFNTLILNHNYVITKSDFDPNTKNPSFIKFFTADKQLLDERILHIFPEQITQNKNLLIAFTSEFEKVDWRPNNTDDQKINWYKPSTQQIQDGMHEHKVNWYKLGDYAVGISRLEVLFPFLDHSDPNDVRTMPVVGVIPGFDENETLRKPEEFEMIWRDSGSGAPRDMWVWNIKCSEGFVALGTAVTHVPRNTAEGEAKPNLEDYRCVRRKYVAPASVVKEPMFSEEVGNDKNYLNTHMLIPGHKPREGFSYLSSGSFYAWKSDKELDDHNEVKISDVNLYVLEAPLPPVVKYRNSSPLATPEEGDETIESVTYLPWYMVSDRDMDDAERYEQTPIYKIERTADWNKIAVFEVIGDYGEEAQEMSFSFTHGHTAEHSREISATVGFSFEVGMEATMGVVGVSASFTASFEMTAGLSWTGTDSLEDTDSVTIKLSKNEGADVFQVVSNFRLYRQFDHGEVSEQIGGTLVSPTKRYRMVKTSY